MPSEKYCVERAVESPEPDDPAQNFLDITAHVCPLTFVRARLALERLAPGQRLVVRLNAGEPLENLPRALADLGYRVTAPAPETGPNAAPGVHRLTVVVKG